MYDELELDLVGDRKTALFFIISDTDATFNFLVSMAYDVSFAVTRIDEERGVAVGIITRIIRQNL